jgi:hypothetical protein
MNENNLLIALSHVETIAIETVKIGKSVETINSAIIAIKGLGFIAIQTGLGKSKPNSNELPYAAYKTAVTGKFSHLSGKPLTKAIADLRQSINFGLQNGGIVTDSNASRAKTGAKTGAKTTRAAKPFDAVKVAAALSGKYTTKQINALIIELEKLVA